MVNCTLNRQKGFGKSMKKKIAAGFAVVILAFLYYYFTCENSSVNVIKLYY